MRSALSLEQTQTVKRSRSTCWIPSRDYISSVCIFPSPGSQGGISDAVQPWRWRPWRNGHRGQESTRNRTGDSLKESPDHCNADRLTFTYTFKPGITCGQNSQQPYICPTYHSSSNTTACMYLSKSESSCYEAKLPITQRIFGGKLSGCLTNVYLVACQIQSNYSFKLTHPFVFSVIQMPENFMTSSYNMLLLRDAAHCSCILSGLQCACDIN